MNGKVIAVCKNPKFTFGKFQEETIHLLEGLGVEGDVHCGAKVRHQYDMKKNPDKPNLRQVHLMHQELFEELSASGFNVGPGQMGENITTSGIDLLSLPEDTLLRIGNDAEIRITGLRTPCYKLNAIQDGLMNALIFKNDEGNIVRKSGIMSVVTQAGTIRVGDNIEVVLPEMPHRELGPV